MKKKVDFGFTKVDENVKEGMVQDVFSSVATNYDLMNDFMSLGLHRLWKKSFINEISPSSYETLLDVAGGTGDIANLYLRSGGGKVIVADLNKEMLVEGRKKFPNNNIEWVHANAEKLPFDDNTFDYYTISFGIRNVTNLNAVLKEAYRVLKPTGKFLCLEFSNVTQPMLAKLYNWYSFKVIPFIGKKIASDRKSYEYLVESICKFPKATQFAHYISNAGFANVEFRKLTFGIVAIHIGYKI